MPSRSSSSSSESESSHTHRHKQDKRNAKQKHRSRSRSRSHSRERTRRKKHKHHRRQREEHRHHSRDSDSEGEHRAHVKHEPVDSGYERRSNKQHRNEESELSKQRRERNVHNERRQKRQNRFQGDNSDFGSQGNVSGEAAAAPVDKDKPNFELSGKLTEDTNTYRGVVIKYSEPPEARKPKRRWRLYPFKGDQALPILHLHRQSAYLMGRERLVADIPVDHPSCSKQHAAIQFRLVPYERPDGSRGNQVRPYVIDLESANGTYLNNKRIDPKRYHELREKDVLKFGFSTREYVVLHDAADTSELHDEGVD